MVIFPITRSGRVEKSQKKKKRKKNFFKRTFSLAVFPISGDKKGEKRKWFYFFPQGGRENVK